MIHNLFGHKISKELEKTQKLSKLRKSFLHRMKQAEFENDLKKQILYYSVELRTLDLIKKIYKEFETFLSQELSNSQFNNLSFSEIKKENETDQDSEFRNKANFILMKFRDIFFTTNKTRRRTRTTN